MESVLILMAVMVNLPSCSVYSETLLFNKSIGQGFDYDSHHTHKQNILQHGSKRQQIQTPKESSYHFRIRDITQNWLRRNMPVDDTKSIKSIQQTQNDLHYKDEATLRTLDQSLALFDFQIEIITLLNCMNIHFAEFIRKSNATNLTVNLLVQEGVMNSSEIIHKVKNNCIPPNTMSEELYKEANEKVMPYTNLETGNFTRFFLNLNFDRVKVEDLKKEVPTDFRKVKHISHRHRIGSRTGSSNEHAKNSTTLSPITANIYDRLSDVLPSTRTSNATTLNEDFKDVLIPTTLRPVIRNFKSTPKISRNKTTLPDISFGIKSKMNNSVLFPEVSYEQSKIDYIYNTGESSRTNTQNVYSPTEPSTTNDARLKATTSSRRKIQRVQFNESEIIIPRIISREYRNDTVSSIINGTEILPNEDFNEGIKDNSTDTDSTTPMTKIYRIYYRVSTPKINIKAAEVRSKDNVMGKLYFINGQHKIPARFIQEPDGTLQLGLDILSHCNNKANQNRSHSTLLSILCDCIQAKKCIK